MLEDLGELVYRYVLICVDDLLLYKLWLLTPCWIVSNNAWETYKIQYAIKPSENRSVFFREISCVDTRPAKRVYPMISDQSRTNGLTQPKESSTAWKTWILSLPKSWDLCISAKNCPSFDYYSKIREAIQARICIPPDEVSCQECCSTCTPQIRVYSMPLHRIFSWSLKSVTDSISKTQG